jgi:hypothetical protein
MKKSLLLLFFVLVLTVTLQAQKDSISIAATPARKDVSKIEGKINLSIYPVPVRDNSFTIRSDRDVSSIKITNIIGQDVYRAQFRNPEQLIRIILDNPKRGMYLVTVIFSDGARVVKKIMVEESE